jgi:hypothetical protein
MPRNITTTVYQYDELSDKAKTKARDEWRRLEAQSGDISWAEPTESSFKEAAAHMGWDVTNVFWCGFSSQGDGAQFEGDWSAARVNEAALKRDWLLSDPRTGEQFEEPSYGYNKRLHGAVERYAAFAAAYPDGSATVVRSSNHYAHSHANEFSVYFGTDAETNEFIEVSRRLMDLFYRMLEQEYDYRNSDKSVAEAIKANGNEFTEDGALYVTQSTTNSN